jgi:hypothetical protein
MADSASVWLEDFFRSYYKFRPVNATFVGIHEYDGKLPDYSQEGSSALEASMEELLDRSQRGLKTSNRMDEIDIELATNFLLIQLGELRGEHFQRGNPAVYSSEGIFGLISLSLREYAPQSERLVSMVSRMKGIPTLLEQGKANVRSAPREWTNEAIRQCDGAIKFLDEGIKILASDWQVFGSNQLTENAEVARKAFQNYRNYLSEELLLHHREGYGCGTTFFDLLLQKGHALRDMDLSKAAEYGNKRVAEQKDKLRRETLKLRPDGDWEKVLSGLSTLHPTLDSILSACQECWAESIKFAKEKDLVEWPDYPLIYKFIDPCFREAAPYLYFLFYRSPAPYDSAKTNYYLISPIEKSLSVEETMQKLRGISYSVIKHNHVVHHGSIGHHLQNYNAYHSPSSVGKVAAVDCASRVAMFCGGTMAEGWATYSTLLMDEAGFNTPEEHIAELHSSVRLAARTVVDANLHSGRFTFEDGVNYYVREIGMTPKAAHGEAVKNSMFPGTGAMYLLGLDQILRLRQDLSAKEGSSFSLRRFHSSLLGFGSIPVAMVSRELLRHEGGLLGIG